jgi:glycosyltransferase involved in cell wall biosynthesis
MERSADDSSGPPVRVLLVSHTCQVRSQGQMKAAWLATLPGIQLHVVTPDRWIDDYGAWRSAETPTTKAFSFEVLKCRLPYVGPFKRYLHHYPKFADVLREFKPDVIDIWEEPWGVVSGHICRLRQRILPSARIISETEQNIDKKLPLPFEKIRRYSLRHADFVIARNAEAVEVTRKKGFVGPAEIVPNAVDVDLFHPLDRQQCRDALGFKGFVAAYVGRMIEEKGLMDMLDALPHLDADVHLAFVGAGPFLPALKQRVAETGREKQVSFLAGRPLEELPAVMNAIDALVLPSRTTASWKEQFGRVIIEAHACQTPVLGSDSGAIPDVVGQGGLIFSERNPAALAGAIMTLKNDPGLVRQMGLAGWRQVHDHYTWQRVASQMHDIYMKVAGRPADVNSVRAGSPPTSGGTPNPAAHAS